MLLFLFVYMARMKKSLIVADGGGALSPTEEMALGVRISFSKFPDVSCQRDLVRDFGTELSEGWNFALWGFAPHRKKDLCHETEVSSAVITHRASITYIHHHRCDSLHNSRLTKHLPTC
jgi:hypothetical protein